MFFRIFRNLALALPLSSLALASIACASAQTVKTAAPAQELKTNRIVHKAGTEKAKPAKIGQAIEVQSAWARQMLPAAKVGAGFFEIKNNSNTALRLISVQSDIAQKVEIHSMIMEDNVMKMRHLADGVEIAAHSGLSFKPGSYHLMFMNPKAPFKAGETFKTRFKFANGEELEVPFTVRAAPAGQPALQHSKMHNPSAAH